MRSNLGLSSNSGRPLPVSVVYFGVLDVEQGKSEAGIEPGEQLVFDPRTDDLHVGAVLGVESITQKYARAQRWRTPQVEHGPCPPFVSLRGGACEQGGDNVENAHLMARLENFACRSYFIIAGCPVHSSTLCQSSCVGSTLRRPWMTRLSGRCTYEPCQRPTSMPVLPAHRRMHGGLGKA